MAAALSPPSSRVRAKAAVAAGGRRPITQLAPRGDSLRQAVRSDRESASRRGRFACPFQQLGDLDLIARHGACLFEEGEGLVVGAQRDGPLGRGPEGDPGLAGEGVGLRSLGRIGVGREVVAGQAAGDLIGLEALEEAGRREVAGLAVLPGEGVVGDLADERLDEGVLAALGRARIGLERSAARAGRGLAGAARARLRRCPDTADSPARVKLWPRTAASDTSARSAGSSPSRRLAMSAVSVSGTARVGQVTDRRDRCRPSRRAGRRRAASGPSRRRTAGCRRRARRWP